MTQRNGVIVNHKSWITIFSSICNTKSALPLSSTIITEYYPTPRHRGPIYNSWVQATESPRIEQIWTYQMLQVIAKNSLLFKLLFLISHLQLEASASSFTASIINQTYLPLKKKFKIHRGMFSFTEEPHYSTAISMSERKKTQTNKKHLLFY